MSNVARKVIKNTVWLSAAEIISAVLMFFPTIWLARYLGSTQFGMLAFATNLAALLALLVDFGLSILLTREVARDRSVASQYLNNILALRLVLGGLYVLSLVVIAWLSDREPVILQLIVLLGVSTVMNNLSQTFAALFRGYERMEFEAIGRVILAGVLAALATWFVVSKAGLTAFGWMYVVSSMAALVFAAFVARTKFLHFRLSYSQTFWRQLFHEAWPFVLSMAFVSVYYYMDSVMLGFMKQNEQVGWYNADYRIIMFLLLFVGIAFNALFPLISRLYKESIERFREVLNDFSKLMVSIALPLGAGGVVLASPIIEFLYGEEYLPGVAAFQILIWSTVIVFSTVAFGNSLLACDKQKIYVRGVGIGAAVNLLFNILLIPRWSLHGAAIATVLAELTVFIYMYIHLRRVARVSIFPYLPRVIIATAAMSGLLLMFKDWSLIITLPLGVLGYGLALWIVGGISRREIHLLRQLIRPRNQAS